MSFEVMLLDTYTVLDSPKRKELVGRLRQFADAPQDEFSDSDMSAYLWAGARVFNANLASWDDVTFVQEHGMLLWASMSICDRRLLDYMKYFPVDSRVGKTDPSKRMDGALKLKRLLREQFEKYLEDTGIILNESTIIVGELIKFDVVVHANIPDSVQHAPPVPVLGLLKKTATTVDLKWISAQFNDFCAYVLYYDTKPNLADPTRIAKSPKPGMREDVTQALELRNYWEQAARIEGLTAGATYWFVVASVDFNGRNSFSAELQVTL